MIKKNINNTGIFCISLDYELFWGVRDVFDDSYFNHIFSTNNSVPRMLELFKQNDISATWAVVAFLLLNKKSLRCIKNKIKIFPQYVNKKQDPYQDMDNLINLEDQLLFAVNNVNKIKSTAHQEIASHTASHIYVLDLINKIEAFEEDLRLSKNIFNDNLVDIKSIIFPRNQFDDETIKCCHKYDITCFRDNQKHFIYEACSGQSNGFFKRLFRLADSYINIFGMHTHKLMDLKVINNCLGIPASMMLRPVRGRIFDAFHLRRIKKSMKYAAKNNELFHLWWHPHNFGNSVDKNIKNLQEIVSYYKELERDYGFKSLNMTEIETLYRGRYDC